MIVGAAEKNNDVMSLWNHYNESMILIWLYKKLRKITMKPWVYELA